MAPITKPDAEEKYTKATTAELAKNYEKAFTLYVKAAEEYLHLSRQSADERLRKTYNSEAAKALERAEKIKAIKQDLKPIIKDEFSDGEQLYVLQKSSHVNQGIFPDISSPGIQMLPSGQPPLSTEQVERGATWLRHKSLRHVSPTGLSSTLQPEDIVQHIVSDCSVCGAIVIAIDHHRRFGSKMIVSSLYPQDTIGFPTTSDSGQYQFRIMYNGTYRHINIDDHLPTYPDGTLMCVSTGDSKAELWPSLVEKAYMKLAGGYDFIGSDSSTDMHALAGWIPEVIDMKSANFQREKTWKRLVDGYIRGDCVATLGTGERIPATDSIDLLSTHCYAVIGVNTSEENPRLTVFDPWVQATSQNNPACDGAVTHQRKRTIELDPESIGSFFDGIYLSWNPAMFRDQLIFHGMWKRDGRRGDACYFRTQVQLDLASEVKDGEEVWLHLTRHVRSHRIKGEYIALARAEGSGWTPSSSEALHTKGEYTDSPHVLVRANISQTEDLLTLVASYEGVRQDVGFTLTVYSNRKASWVHTPQKLLYSKDVEGAFTQKTAGGNHTYPTCYLNPQYHLRVHPSKDVSTRAGRDTKVVTSFTVSTDRHVPVNVLIAWSQGGRIHELVHNDIALSSGPYSYGCAHVSGRIPPGDYTLAVSAFEPRHLGKFSLRVECSDRFEITPILQDGVGMFNKVVRGEWTVRTAGGGPSSGSYASNPTYELQIPSASQLKCRLQLAEPSPATALNLTIFNTVSGSSVSLGHHIATSGPYSDAVSGVVIEQLTLQPGRYLVVPSTYKVGHTAGFRIIVYSTASGVQLTPVQT